MMDLDQKMGLDWKVEGLMMREFGWDNVDFLIIIFLCVCLCRGEKDEKIKKNVYIIKFLI